MVKIFVALLLSTFYSAAFADSLELKNGRSIEGIIIEEGQDTVKLEVCQGVISFRKTEINRITKADAARQEQIRQRCARQQQESKERLLKKQAEEDSKPKGVAFSQDSSTITVGVRLNNKIDASLVLDTGASLIMLRKDIAKGLGIELDGVKPDGKMTLADGRQVNAKRIILESVRVEGVEAENVSAAIILDEVGNFSFGDGLLGMSFLSRFNFKVDHRQKRLILEKLYP